MKNFTTEEVIKEFKESWVEAETSYEDLIRNDYGFGRLDLLKDFISELRLAGEDENLRLGTQIQYLIISRSKEHGLRTSQKYIRIETTEANQFEIVMSDGNQVYFQYTIDNLKDIRLEQLLQRLKIEPID